MAPPALHRDSGQDGFALVAVIVLLMIVTTVVAGFALAARSGLDLAADRLAADRLGLLADGLVMVVAHDLARAQSEDTRPTLDLDGTPAACAANGLSITVRVQDQRGLVDLNAAEEDLLVLALRSLGVSAPTAAESAKVILAYRTPGRDAAAEALSELTRDGLKGGAFAATEELHDLMALANVPAERLAATFTTVSGEVRVTGPRLPAGLAAVLPRGPTPLRPFVTADATITGPYAIEVFARGPDGTLGRAGRLVEIGAGGAERRARLTLAGSAPDTLAQPRTASCAALFGVGAAAHLGDLPT